MQVSQISHKDSRQGETSQVSFRRFGPWWRTAGEILKLPFYKLYQRRMEVQAQSWRIPRHIGIIMDGNRRFARYLNLGHVSEGHARGADKLEEVLSWCEEFGVKVVSVWVFSLDNFKRDPDEVNGLMALFERKFLELVRHPRIHENQIRVRTLGRTDVLPESVRQAIVEVEEATRTYTRRNLNVVLAYGGREEITDAVRKYLREGEVAGRSLQDLADNLQPGVLEPYLYTSEMPDPDLIIRTSGEVRLSGFLLWQSVYSELHFCDTNWPAFRKIDFLRALREYNQRKRRFGQ